MQAVAVTALVIEAIQNTVSGVMSGPLAMSTLAERALVHDPLVGGSDGDDTRNDLGVDRLPKRLVDLPGRASGQPGFIGRRALAG